MIGIPSLYHKKNTVQKENTGTRRAYLYCYVVKPKKRCNAVQMIITL